MMRADVVEKLNGEVVNEYSMNIPTEVKKDFVSSLMEYGYSHNNIGAVEYMCKTDNGLEKVVKIYK